MPAKGSSKNPRYLGLDGRGYPMWKASCGHVVWSGTATRCPDCYNAPRRKPDFIGTVDGHNQYRAACGHIAKRTGVKRCRRCVTDQRHTRHPYSPGYYPVLSRANGEPQRRVHTEAAERVLGRKLRRDEVVHHLNMDKFDGRNCNLLICTRTYHQYLHHAMALRYARGCAPPKPTT